MIAKQSTSLSESAALRPAPFDTASYVRDMASDLAALAGEVGLIGVSALCRAAANEAAEALRRMRAHASEGERNAAAGEAT